MTAPVFGLVRLCPACKGVGQTVSMGPAVRPAMPHELRAVRRHGVRRPNVCYRCKGEGTIPT